MSGAAQRIGRRSFLSASGRAVAAGFALRASAAPRAQAQGAPRVQPRGPAANRVRLAIIGFGARGTALARSLLSVQGVEVVAVADLYEGRLHRARELLGERVRTSRGWRPLLDQADVDAVIVATPDHWHARMTEQALSAGVLGKGNGCSPRRRTASGSCRVEAAGFPLRCLPPPGKWWRPAGWVV
ncbi:MAG: Gfo/Idh/MocA family oxidoreductase [Acidobacteria bacterium]|nr:Gfo/Idh/MocA family oxidoreductase [Acidobacteriota bacterium]